MKTENFKGINTVRYSDIFLAMYFDDGKSCLHRNHSHWCTCILENWKSKKMVKSRNCIKETVRLFVKISVSK